MDQNRINTALERVLAETGVKYAMCAIKYIAGNHPDAGIAEITVMTSSSYTGSSNGSVDEAAEKAIVRFKEIREREAAIDAVCEHCKTHNNAYVERSKNNRRLTDKHGETWNTCGYRCLHQWGKSVFKEAE